MLYSGLPARPAHLSVYAEACLQALAWKGWSEYLSLGSGLGVLHDLDYRPKHDADAWWDKDTPPQTRQAIPEALQNALRPWGEVTTLAWGEVANVELVRDGEEEAFLNALPL